MSSLYVSKLLKGALCSISETVTVCAVRQAWALFPTQTPLMYLIMRKNANISILSTDWYLINTDLLTITEQVLYKLHETSFVSIVKICVCRQLNIHSHHKHCDGVDVKCKNLFRTDSTFQNSISSDANAQMLNWHIACFGLIKCNLF